ncbi:MAG: hypothetical protein JSS79_02785 [Bacteroidetes bacterium]|nr:hypothetical protein [Bacteroidota bacterium]
MLVANSKGLSIHVIRKLKLAVFTWHGFTPSDVFKEGTIQSLETLRKYPEINRIILNTRKHSLVMHDDIDQSVQSTVDYLGVARGNYKMAVIPPEDVLAQSSMDWYIDSLNQVLKKRFVVRKYQSVKDAFYGLLIPKICSWCFHLMRSRSARKNTIVVA